MRIGLGALSLILGASLLPTVGAQDSTGDASIVRRLEEIERRLDQMEGSVETPNGEDPHTVEVKELRRQVDVLAEELEKIRSGEEEYEVTEKDARALGLGPSAASVYRKRQGVSISGYGEMLYQNFSDRNESGAAVSKGSELDYLRGVLYAGYRFNDKFLFNSEIEFEHASTSLEGSASVEFGYIDYLASDHLGLRGGLLLVPMGLINEFHEPNAFIGALRSETESRIIPSTWRENGFGIFGSAGMVDYRAYLINGLDGSRFSSNGLRSGRQKGSEAKASNMAFVGRLDVAPAPGIFFGGSFYRGGSGQGQVIVDGKEYDVTTTIGELHTQIQMRGIDLRGLWARATVDDAAELNRFLGLTGSSSVGEDLQGGFLQLGYNLLNEFQETASLMPFFRYEKVNTQHSVPAEFFREPARNRDFFTLGLEFKPIRNIVLKSDFQWVHNQAESGVNQFNLGLGYAF